MPSRYRFYCSRREENLLIELQGDHQQSPTGRACQFADRPRWTPTLSRSPPSHSLPISLPCDHVVRLVYSSSHLFDLPRHLSGVNEERSAIRRIIYLVPDLQSDLVGRLPSYRFCVDLPIVHASIYSRLCPDPVDISHSSP